MIYNMNTTQKKCPRWSERFASDPREGAGLDGLSATRVYIALIGSAG